MPEPNKTAAEIFLTAMKAGGVDYVFANAGTDFAPILEALIAGRGTGAAYPEFVIAPHENAAVAMAQGYYLATGHPQAAMVHVNVGVANALCGLMNAARDNIPMLFASGRTPVTEEGRRGARDNFIHWGQEMFDQAAMLREIVKWDYELRYPEQAGILVERALAIASSEPRGPVYLSLPRETLAETADVEITPRPIAPASSPQPDVGAIDQAAKIIAAAERPLLITSRVGKSAAAVEALDRLAERFAIPVVEFCANYMCLRTDHPLHAGFNPAPLLETADAVIVADAPVAWPASKTRPPADCRVIHLAPDPLFGGLPYRGFRADLNIATEMAAGLAALSDALETAADSTRVEARRKALIPRLEKERTARLEKAAAPGARITHAYASHCLNKALGPDGVLVNERGALREAMTYSKPGTFFGPTIAGGLGASIGVALGVKLADPSRLVAAAMGDGSCIFNNPVACLQIAAARKLPILIAVLNNCAWQSVQASTVQTYPGGLTSKTNDPPLTSLAPSPDYAAVAEACGAEDISVSDPVALPAALAEAVKTVRNGKNTVLVDIAVA
ncbi:MAG: thiamine pyrophosphate-requiring protein [Parvularculaceae bacterium]